MERIIREIKLARGVLVHKDRVLLVRCTRPGEGHFFLPGGNVEPGESIPKALVREWKEELGWSITVGNFIGCVESHWDYSRKADGAKVDVFEVNFIFHVMAPQEHLLDVIRSQEPNLEFHWVALGDVQDAHILPLPMKKVISSIRPLHSGVVWESTL